jgi:hypothetical protein
MDTAKLTRHARYRFEQRSGVGSISQSEVPIFLSECRRCTNREVRLIGSQTPGTLYVHDSLGLIAVIRDGFIVTFLAAKRDPARDRKWKRKNKAMLKRRDRKRRKAK